MLKFTLGFTSGALIGIASTFVAGVIAAVIVEDSPEILKAIVELNK